MYLKITSLSLLNPFVAVKAFIHKRKLAAETKARLQEEKDEEEWYNYHYPETDSYQVPYNEEYEKENNYPYMERDEDGFYHGTCKCGGMTTPMYDEHPFWIAFCKSCDRRWEGDTSPLPY